MFQQDRKSSASRLPGSQKKGDSQLRSCGDASPGVWLWCPDSPAAQGIRGRPGPGILLTYSWVTELEASRTALAFLLRLFQLKMLNKIEGPQEVSLTLLNSAPSTKLLPSS